MNKITLLINCKDQSGIIAATTNFILKNRGNITYVDQHVDRQKEVFFMRLECNFEILNLEKKDFINQFKVNVAQVFQMNWKIYDEESPSRMAIFVSKYDHCLYDILVRYNSGELNVEIPFIVSNHKELKPIADSFNIPFFHVPIKAETREKAQHKHLELLKKYKVDFIVLARYMQIIPEGIIASYPSKIINIHHSFLPAFVGAKPYHSAFERGVKIIGATSHYVTTDLDAGPIIEQNVSRVSHFHSISDLIAKGRDLEKIVLATAIKYHICHKVMVYENKTVVFS